VVFFVENKFLEYQNRFICKKLFRDNECITLAAFAKINLGLKIGEKKKNGLHKINMITQSISLCDIIKVFKIEKKKINIISDKYVCEPKKNLVYKTILEFFKIYRPNFGIGVKIQKKIPHMAGLGGGSADAAAVLLALNIMCKTNFETDELVKIAFKIGSDVPLCMIGSTLLCEGQGEILTLLNSLPNCKILLKISNNKVSTSEAYEQFDKFVSTNMSFEKSDNFDRITNLKKSIETEDIEKISNFCFNDFELLNKPELGWHLSGSGASTFKLVKKVNGKHDKNTFICNPVNYGVKIIETSHIS